MKSFLCENFLLESTAAERLYHEHAKKMPIFDYHSHLPPAQIARNHAYSNLTEIWLGGDHYKWRIMRANGVAEAYCTGDAEDYQKFEKWAETIPYALGNPLYHWTHMELKKPFGLEGLILNKDTAKEVWEHCNGLLQKDDFRVQGLLRQFDVRFIGTTDDPADSLEHHRTIRESGLNTEVQPTFRPDALCDCRDPQRWRAYLSRLSRARNIAISSWSTLCEAVKASHDYFHEQGCRIADHSFMAPVFKMATEAELNTIFWKVFGGKALDTEEEQKLQTALLLYMGRLHSARDWAMQLHIGALRNNNSRMFKTIGPDRGYDAIADSQLAVPLARLLDTLEKSRELPRTILYTLNPVHNELLVALAGCFQDGSVPGKIQFGSGWWFNDQKDGMLRQMTALSQLGLLSRFVGMLTDSRSFLSFSRHEYFRRILCNLLGGWVERGEVPADYDLLGRMVEDISFNNARSYFTSE